MFSDTERTISRPNRISSRFHLILPIFVNITDGYKILINSSRTAGKWSINKIDLQRNKLLSGFIIVSGGQSLTYILSFLRNIILARLLTKADYGLAAIFSLTVGMIELTARMSLGAQLIQAEDGDSERFQQSAQAVQLIAGGLSALIILALCSPSAHIFKVPEKAWAFAILAFIPLFRGLSNLDFQRYKRRFNFLPSIWVELIPQTISLILVWPLVKLIGDFRVVLILLLTKELMTLIMTHIIAKRSYRLCWDKVFIQRMWNFSWPLIINGFLIFAAQQGDQMLVGGGFNLEILAIYAAAASLIAAPFMILCQAAGSIILPLLSRVQKSPEEFNREYRVCVQIIALGAIAVIIPLIISGEQILSIFYGSKYTGGGVIMAWLAAGCAIRFLRIAPTTAAIAKADTQNQMISNFYRISTVLFSGIAIILGGSVETVASCVVVGEVAALFSSTARLDRRLGIPATDVIKSAIFMMAILSSAGGLILLGVHQLTILAAICVSLIVITAGMLLGWLVFPGIIELLWHEIYEKRSRKKAATSNDGSGF